MENKLKSAWDKVIIKAEKNTGELITKPNQSMSVREILFRNTQGMSYDNYKTPYYEDQATFSSQSLNKIQEMEPVEKLQYLKEVSSQVKTLTDKISTFEKERQEALMEQQKQSEVTVETKTETSSE